MLTEIISLDHARKERKDRYLSVMNTILADIFKNLKPMGCTDMEMNDAFIRAERVIQSGGTVADALYQALKPYFDEPPEAA